MSHLLNNENTEEIEDRLLALTSRHAELTTKIFKINDALNNEKAKEYLFHGVLRRLNTIERCVENIYSIFPIRRKTLLNRNELKDIDINLHAFFINIYGLLDNMAWVVVHEKGKAKSINKFHVGLYAKKTQKYLNDDFKKYLNSDRMKKWYGEYLKDFRDPLSHRIPLYVPPKFWKPGDKEKEEELFNKIGAANKRQDFDEVNILRGEMDNIGIPAPAFTHSFSEESKLVQLHAQVITDFGTVEEITENFCAMFNGDTK